MTEPTPVYIYDLQILTQQDEFRWDMAQAVSPYQPGPGTIAQANAVTVSWTFQFSTALKYPLSFGDITGTLGGSYSQSMTTTTTNTLQLPSGVTAQLVYVPFMHHVTGWLTVTYINGESGETEVEVDHQWVDLFFPLAETSGEYALQYVKGGIEGQPAGPAWQQNSLTGIAQAPQAASAPFGYVSPDGTARVIYRDVNHDITEIFLAPGSTWQHDLLTGIADAPQAASAPMGYVSPDKVSRVIYQDVNNNVTEISLAPGQGWVQKTLNAVAEAPPAAGAPFGYVTPDEAARVVYQDPNGGIDELWLGSPAPTGQPTTSGT